MAPTKLFLSVLLLISMLAATSTADDQPKIILQPRPEPPQEPAACLPRQAFPAYVLPRCRAYLKLKCTSEWVPEPVRQECCRQLAAVQDGRCRCPAIAHMLGSMLRELGVKQEQEEAFPGCRTFMMSQVAARLPTVCAREVPQSASACSWAS